MTLPTPTTAADVRSERGRVLALSEDRKKGDLAMNAMHRRHEAINHLRHEATTKPLAPRPSSGTPPTHAVSAFMTPSPHSIGREQPLETAHAMMRKHGIRHLPVLEGGKLAGMLSAHDLYFVEAEGGVDARAVKVEEAMSPDTYCVAPTTPVEEVAVDMAERKYGCAVVMDGTRVAGVLTTTDALRALAGLVRRNTLSPST